MHFSGHNNPLGLTAGLFLLWVFLQAGSESDPPLEGAKARLEELKESLYQREREISELLETERTPIPSLSQLPCSVLLPIVIHKVIFNSCTNNSAGDK